MTSLKASLLVNQMVNYTKAWLLVKGVKENFALFWQPRKDALEAVREINARQAMAVSMKTAALGYRQPEA